jgi:mono/diheme cytochrome c family protein
MARTNWQNPTGRLLLGLALAAGLAAQPTAGPMTTGAGKSDSAPTAALGGGDAERGRQLFANNGCGWCHEKTGRKAGKGPRLMDSPRTDTFIAERIRTGKQGRMPNFGRSLNDQQISDLVAFIRAIKPEGAP